MTHLGTVVSALVDGQLSPADAERALAHVAACPACADEVAAVRAARQALLSAFDVPTDPDLTRRLLRLGPAAPTDSGAWRHRSGVRGTPRAHGGEQRGFPHNGRAGGDVRFDDSLPLPGSESTRPGAATLDSTALGGRALSGELGRRSAGRRWTVAATAGVGVMAAGLFVLGQQPQITPSAHPGHALTVLGRAAGASSGNGTGADPAVWMLVGQGASTSPAPWAATGAVEVVRATVTTLDASQPTPGDAVLDGSVMDRTVPDRTVPGDVWLDDPAQGRADGAAARSDDEETARRVLGWMANEGWDPPSVLPVGYRVGALRTEPEGADSLELDLVGDHGLVVVTLQRGRLDPGVVTGTMALDVDGGSVHVLSTEPWHAAWQAGDTVVSVLAERPAAVLDDLVGAFPVRDYDTAAAARITRGWHVLAEVWDR